MNQREGTVSTILLVLNERGVDYELNGPTPISDVLTDTDKANIRGLIIGLFQNGDMTFKDQPTTDKYLNDESELKKYVSGLVNNWIRKAKEFNGGNQYVAKNPGSRQHVGDETLRELKKLSAQCASDPEAMKTIADEIVKRKAELELKKAKSIEINPDVLPEHLRKFIRS